MVKHLNCQFTKPQTMKKFLHLNFHTQLCQLNCQSFAIVEILQKMEGCSMGQNKKTITVWKGLALAEVCALRVSFQLHGI